MMSLRRNLAVGAGLVMVAALVVAGLVFRTEPIVGRSQPGNDVGAGYARRALNEIADSTYLTKGLRFRGTLTDPEGKKLRLDATVLNAGTVSGSVTRGGARAEMFGTDDKLFLRAGPAYWKSSGFSDEQVAGFLGHWVRVSPAEIGLDVPHTLAPRLLAIQLRQSPQDSQQLVNLKGEPALKTSTGTERVYLTMRAPRRVLRVEIDPPPSRFAPAGPVEPLAMANDGAQLDVDDVPASDVQSLLTKLDAKVKEVAASVDSRVRLSGSLNLSACTPNGCVATVTVHYGVIPDPYVKPGPANATLTVRWTLDGRPVGTCGAAAVLRPESTTPMSCGVSYFLPPEVQPRQHQVEALGQLQVSGTAKIEVNQILNDLKKERRATTCAPNSFLPGTPVLLADGHRRPIDRIALGDVVLAADPASGRPTPATVSGIIRGAGVRHLVHVTVDTGGGHSPATLTATDEHPFWTPDAHAWTTAAELRPGDRLQTPDGDPVTVRSVRPEDRITAVLNLTVERVHTYYVGVGDRAVLVHNKDEQCMVGANGVRVTSKTVWPKSRAAFDKNGIRIDVENPSPGKRPGQLHLQTKNAKYQWNFETGQFDGLPPSIAKVIASSPDIQRAILLGLNSYLGV